MKLKVLIVDDSKVAVKVINEALNGAVYDKRVAVNGQEALELYRAWKPDVMFLDIMMPIVSGFAVLKEIRDGEKDNLNAKKTGVVMITALADKASITDCLKLGIQGYLVKPFPPEEVAARAEEAYRKVNTSAASGDGKPGG
jgi:CheY-like chemotaxis protein